MDAVIQQMYANYAMMMNARLQGYQMKKEELLLFDDLCRSLSAHSRCAELSWRIATEKMEKQNENPPNPGGNP